MLFRSLLTVEGELDDISGAGQTKAAHALCTGVPDDRKFHYDVVGAGHYGIFSGRRWREKVYPEVRDFIRRFGTPVAAANGKALTEGMAEADAPVPAPAPQAQQLVAFRRG